MTSRTILVAPDSFKGSLSSSEVALALAAGWRLARPDDEVLLCPLADGGGRGWCPRPGPPTCPLDLAR